uniref:Uncharacterized protein n=1 Tax=Rhizophora mucronata TaxID=61149 RepID=A0A2P2PVK2_RHIMU
MSPSIRFRSKLIIVIQSGLWIC